MTDHQSSIRPDEQVLVPAMLLDALHWYTTELLAESFLEFDERVRDLEIATCIAFLDKTSALLEEQAPQYCASLMADLSQIDAITLLPSKDVEETPWRDVPDPDDEEGR